MQFALSCWPPSAHLFVLDVVEKLERVDRLLNLVHRREARLHVGDHSGATRLALVAVTELRTCPAAARTTAINIIG